MTLPTPPARLLGKKPYTPDPRRLQFAKYAAALPAPPASVNWDHYVATWPMFLNDSLGDCTCAAAGHMIELWTAAAGAEATVTDNDVLAVYEAVGGYVPGQPNTDQGAVIADVLAYWQKTGVGGHKLAAYTEVAYSNVTLVEQAIDLLGAVDTGLQLPIAAQSMGQHWVSPPAAPPSPHHPWWEFWAAKEHPAARAALTGEWAPGSWGGHSVPAVSYDSVAKTFTVVSWGELITVDFGFAAAYLDEVWACLSTDFINTAGQDPQGFDLAQLQADFAAL